jgi:hypothetical protein
LKSHLTIHRDLILKKPYSPKADQNFATMAAAEQKRRRKRLRNLEHALATHQPIGARKASTLWTPPN